MISRIESQSRGHFNLGWLDTHHSFSFGEYHNPKAMGFGSLRVINEDFVNGGAGFDWHPHRDMEILTYIISGALEHQDSLGTRSIIRPGEIQRMSAGSGIKHREWNPSDNEKTHLLQIWILPSRQGVVPSYEQNSISPKNGLTLIASGRGLKDQVTYLLQDIDVFEGRGTVNQKIILETNRKAWVQIVTGSVTINGQPLQPGDGASIENEPFFDLNSEPSSLFLLFDLI